MARRAPASTKADLLHAAEHCFASQGLEATKIEEITARTGIAKGAFYSYFASKEACFKEIVDAFLARLSEVVDRHSASLRSRAPLSERLEIWQAHDLEVFEFCWENRVLLGLLFNGAGGTAYSHLLDEFARRSACNADTLVRSLIAEGVYARDLDPTLTAALLGGAYDRLAREVVQADKRPDLEAMVHKAQRVFLRGVLADRSRDELDRRRPEQTQERSKKRKTREKAR